MAYHWLLKSQTLLIAPLALLLIIAVACGGVCHSNVTAPSHYGQCRSNGNVPGTSSR